MRVHLVGGFLGSGKTTAIAAAARNITQQGKTAGVVTNDQGKYLVDSRFMDITGIECGEVTGGCFCCNYDQLDAQIQKLRENANPDVIFAESVGSCTDLVATVLRPMLKFHKDDIEAITFSGFVDAQLLFGYFQGKQLPFSAETNYIWEKQIEEAEILIVNKIDLLSAEESDQLRDYTVRAYPRKKILFQNSLSSDSIGAWIGTLSSFQPPQERNTVEVDYRIYGAGEANLAWLDEELTFRAADPVATKKSVEFIERVVDRMLSMNLPIGHLKFFLSNGSESAKISFTTTAGRSNTLTVPLADAERVTLGINARIEATPDVLRALIADVISEFQMQNSVSIEERNISFFQPGFPNPTHRLTDTIAV